MCVCVGGGGASCRAACHSAISKVDTENSCLWSSVCQPSALRAACWWLVWHVCLSHSSLLNCFGVWQFVPIKSWATTYSYFVAALNSCWPQTDAILRCALPCVEWNFRKWRVQYMCPCTVHDSQTCTAMCRVKFWKVKSTVHVSMYSARCSEIWGSLATPIVKKILYL